jgi:hypothetical protein
MLLDLGSPRDEEVVIMNGAQTFWTVGKTQSSRITLGYYKRTAQSSYAIKTMQLTCISITSWFRSSWRSVRVAPRISTISMSEQVFSFRQ